MTTLKIYPTRLLLLLCLFAAIAATPAQQQQEPSPAEPDDVDVLRISTELVQTDVAIQIQVLSEIKPLLRTQMLKISTEGLTDFARIPYSAAIPLTNMPVG